MFVCPTGEVAAPAARVWALMSHPRNLDLWWDARTDRVEPDGPMAAGQRIYASARGLGRTFALTFDVVEVDPAAHLVRLEAHLAFGIVDHVTLKVSPLDERTSRLSFG